MSYETGSPISMDEEDKEKKVYITLSLAKYPFLKNQKVGSKGEANFKGEIERSETHEESGEAHHTVCFQDLSNSKSGRRI